jgi:hypothetical protein
MDVAVGNRTVGFSDIPTNIRRKPIVKIRTRTTAANPVDSEAGAATRNRRTRHASPKRFSFLDDSCMSRAMCRL